VIVRIWRTTVDPARVGEYQQFAETISLPMFRAHAGFLGVLFARSPTGDERAVLSFWDGPPSVLAFNTSLLYQSAVRQIEDAGFLVGHSSVEILEVEAGILDSTLATRFHFPK